MMESLFFFVTYVFALHWAAEYSDAEDVSYLKCTILSVVLVIVQFIVRILLPFNTLLSGIVLVIVTTIICIKVLKIPASNFLMFIVMFVFFHLIVSGISSLVINGIANS